MQAAPGKRRPGEQTEEKEKPGVRPLVILLLVLFCFAS
jgi:hypothetical protein